MNTHSNITAVMNGFSKMGFNGKLSKYSVFQHANEVEIQTHGEPCEWKYRVLTDEEADKHILNLVRGESLINNAKKMPQFQSLFKVVQTLRNLTGHMNFSEARNLVWVDPTREAIVVQVATIYIEVHEAIEYSIAVGTNTVFNYLASHGHTDAENHLVKAGTRFGKVVVFINDQVYNSDLTVDEFNNLWEE